MHKLTQIFSVLVISVAVVFAVLSLRNDSIIVDEIPHIGAGYSYLTKHDMRLNPEHPPLAKDLAAIPLAFMKLKQGAFDTDAWTTDLNGQWKFGRALIFNTGNDADKIRIAVKLPMLLFFILAAIMVFYWGRKLYGDVGGITGLIIFSFSPTILAHSRFVTTDVAALFGIILSTYFFVRYLQNPTRSNLVIAGLATGVGLATKFSTVLLIPFFAILALVWGYFGIPSLKKLPQKAYSAVKYFGGTVFVFLIGLIIVVYPLYYFNTYNYPAERQYNDARLNLATYGNRLFADPIVWASNKPVIRPLAEYAVGILKVNQRAIGGNTTYFLGEVSRMGWHNYFPIIYFIKEPIAWWLSVIIALVMIGFQLRKPFRKPKNRFQDFIVKHFAEFAMLLWLVIYWAVSINSTLNIGVRHLLPIYPFAILLVTGQLSRIGKARIPAKLKKSIVTLVVLIMGWYVLESINIYPYYLTYFNQFAGGPQNGYKYAVDSNIDWGQDLIRFSDWVKQNNIPKIETDYFGWADAQYYLSSRYIPLWGSKYLDGNDFSARNESDGWMAVSASFLMGSQGSPDQPNPINYIWLQSYKPYTVIGHSIFIYRIK